MGKNITLTTEEIELIYSALLVYGDKLREVNNLHLDTETEDRIAQRVNKSYSIAVKMIETKTAERGFTYEEGYEDGVSNGIEEIKDEIRKLESNGVEAAEIVDMIKTYNS